MSAPSLIICDIDGTLALHHSRNPYDWRSAGQDRLNTAVHVVLRAVQDAGMSVAYVSGRPEEARTITEDWLLRHECPPGPLLLRQSGDNRRDAVIKREFFETRLSHLGPVALVLDDRDQVVQMWREELGLPCFQVAPGNF